MASAASRMIRSVTWFSHTYQLFQPMCGVSARVSPTTIRNGRIAVPWRFVAVRVTACAPGVDTDPLMRPVVGSRRSPFGRPSAPKRIGRSPVAAIVKRKGDPGRTPKERAPLMRGAGPAAA